MMPKNLWLKFPEEVRLYIATDVEQLTYELAKKFDLADDQILYVLDLEDDIFLKNKNIIDLANHLDKMPGSKNVDVRLLALDLAYKVFWPLQDYLEEVDRLILRLGGKVPKQKKIRAKEEKKSNIFKGSEEGSVKQMLESYENFSELRLTSSKIIDKNGRTVSPTVEKWIEDYVHFLGAGNHDSLKRARYLSKAPNVLSVSSKDRDKLRKFFVSYDEENSLNFTLEGGVLMIEDQKEEVSRSKVNEPDFNQSNVLETFHQKIKTILGTVLSENIIMSEAENNVNKVGDVLWKAIGIGDKDKVLGCVRLLVNRKALDKLIKEDKRFKSILKRFIGVKFGKIMERALDEDLDKLITRRLFLEMLLAEKLGLKDNDLFATVYYLTNIIPNSGQLIYLDKKDSQFKWREVQVVGNKFAWVDNV